MNRKEEASVCQPLECGDERSKVTAFASAPPDRTIRRPRAFSKPQSGDCADAVTALQNLAALRAVHGSFRRMARRSVSVNFGNSLILNSAVQTTKHTEDRKARVLTPRRFLQEI